MSRNSSLAVLADCTDLYNSHVSSIGLNHRSSVLSIENETILSNNTDVSPSQVIGSVSFLERVQSTDLAALFPRGSLNQKKKKKKKSEISLSASQLSENISSLDNNTNVTESDENVSASFEENSEKQKGETEGKFCKPFNKRLYLKKKSVNISFDSGSLNNSIAEKSLRRSRRAVNVSLEPLSPKSRNVTESEENISASFEGSQNMENEEESGKTLKNKRSYIKKKSVNISFDSGSLNNSIAEKSLKRNRQVVTVSVNPLPSKSRNVMEYDENLSASFEGPQKLEIEEEPDKEFNKKSYLKKKSVNFSFASGSINSIDESTFEEIENINAESNNPVNLNCEKSLLTPTDSNIDSASSKLELNDPVFSKSSKPDSLNHSIEENISVHIMTKSKIGSCDISSLITDDTTSTPLRSENLNPQVNNHMNHYVQKSLLMPPDSNISGSSDLEQNDEVLSKSSKSGSSNHSTDAKISENNTTNNKIESCQGLSSITNDNSANTSVRVENINTEVNDPFIDVTDKEESVSASLKLSQSMEKKEISVKSDTESISVSVENINTEVGNPLNHDVTEQEENISSLKRSQNMEKKEESVRVIKKNSNLKKKSVNVSLNNLIVEKRITRNSRGPMSQDGTEKKDRLSISFEESQKIKIEEEPAEVLKKSVNISFDSVSLNNSVAEKNSLIVNSLNPVSVKNINALGSEESASESLEGSENMKIEDEIAKVFNKRSHLKKKSVNIAFDSGYSNHSTNEKSIPPHISSTNEIESSHDSSLITNDTMTTSVIAENINAEVNNFTNHNVSEKEESVSVSLEEFQNINNEDEPAKVFKKGFYLKKKSVNIPFDTVSLNESVAESDLENNRPVVNDSLNPVSSKNINALESEENASDTLGGTFSISQNMEIEKELAKVFNKRSYLKKKSINIPFDSDSDSLQVAEKDIDKNRQVMNDSVSPFYSKSVNVVEPDKNVSISFEESKKKETEYEPTNIFNKRSYLKKKSVNFSFDSGSVNNTIDEQSLKQIGKSVNDSSNSLPSKSRNVMEFEENVSASLEGTQRMEHEEESAKIFNKHLYLKKKSVNIAFDSGYSNHSTNEKCIPSHISSSNKIESSHDSSLITNDTMASSVIAENINAGVNNSTNHNVSEIEESVSVSLEEFQNINNEDEPHKVFKKGFYLKKKSVNIPFDSVSLNESVAESDLENNRPVVNDSLNPMSSKNINALESEENASDSLGGTFSISQNMEIEKELAKVFNKRSYLKKKSINIPFDSDSLQVAEKDIDKNRQVMNDSVSPFYSKSVNVVEPDKNVSISFEESKKRETEYEPTNIFNKRSYLKKKSVNFSFDSGSVNNTIDEQSLKQIGKSVNDSSNSLPSKSRNVMEFEENVTASLEGTQRMEHEEETAKIFNKHSYLKKKSVNIPFDSCTLNDSVNENISEHVSSKSNIENCDGSALITNESIPNSIRLENIISESSAQEQSEEFLSKSSKSASINKSVERFSEDKKDKNEIKSCHSSDLVMEDTTSTSRVSRRVQSFDSRSSDLKPDDPVLSKSSQPDSLYHSIGENISEHMTKKEIVNGEDSSLITDITSTSLRAENIISEVKTPEKKNVQKSIPPTTESNINSGSRSIHLEQNYNVLSKFSKSGSSNHPTDGNISENTTTNNNIESCQESSLITNNTASTSVRVENINAEVENPLNHDVTKKEESVSASLKLSQSMENKEKSVTNDSESISVSVENINTEVENPLNHDVTEKEESVSASLKLSQSMENKEKSVTNDSESISVSVENINTEVENPLNHDVTEKEESVSASLKLSQSLENKEKSVTNDSESISVSAENINTGVENPLNHDVTEKEENVIASLTNTIENCHGSYPITNDTACTSPRVENLNTGSDYLKQNDSVLSKFSKPDSLNHSIEENISEHITNKSKIGSCDISSPITDYITSTSLRENLNPEVNYHMNHNVQKSLLTPTYSNISKSSDLEQNYNVLSKCSKSSSSNSSTDLNISENTTTNNKIENCQGSSLITNGDCANTSVRVENINTEVVNNPLNHDVTEKEERSAALKLSQSLENKEISITNNKESISVSVENINTEVEHHLNHDVTEKEENVSSSLKRSQNIENKEESVRVIKKGSNLKKKSVNVSLNNSIVEKRITRNSRVVDVSESKNVIGSQENIPPSSNGSQKLEIEEEPPKVLRKRSYLKNQSVNNPLDSHFSNNATAEKSFKRSRRPVVSLDSVSSDRKNVMESEENVPASLEEKESQKIEIEEEPPKVLRTRSYLKNQSVNNPIDSGSPNSINRMNVSEHKSIKNKFESSKSTEIKSTSVRAKNINAEFKNPRNPNIQKSLITPNNSTFNSERKEKKCSPSGNGTEDFIHDISIIPNPKPVTRKKMYHSTPITRTFNKKNRDELKGSNDCEEKHDDIQLNDKMIQVSKSIFGSSTEITNATASKKKSVEFSTTSGPCSEKLSHRNKRKIDSQNSGIKKLPKIESINESRSYHSNFLSTFEDNSSYCTTRKSIKRVAFKSLSSSSDSGNSFNYYASRSRKSVGFRGAISLIEDSTDYSSEGTMREADNSDLSIIDPNSVKISDLPGSVNDSKSRIERTDLSLNYSTEVPEIILSENEIEDQNESFQECSLFNNLIKMAEYKRSGRNIKLSKGSKNLKSSNLRKSHATTVATQKEKWVSPNLIKFLNDKLLTDALDHVINTERIISVLCSAVSAVRTLEDASDIDFALLPLKNILLKFGVCENMIEYCTFISRFTPFEFQRKSLPLGGYFGSYARNVKKKLTDPILTETEKMDVFL